MSDRRCEYHDEPLPCWRCKSEEAYEREFDAEGRSRTSPYPCSGTVWFDGGKKYPAVIYGTWDGWAVATVPKKAALKMLAAEQGLTVVNATSTRIEVRTDSTGAINSVLSDGKRLFFGPGWSLHHTCLTSRRRPRPLPSRWRSLCGGMEN